jgi:hypothetical protein
MEEIQMDQILRHPYLLVEIPQMGLILRPQQQGEILMPRLQQEGQQEHPPEHPLEHPLQETSPQEGPPVQEETSPQEHQQLEEPSQQEHPQETSQQVKISRQKEIIQTIGNRQLLHITQQPRQIQQRFLPANASTRVAVLSTTVGANVSTSPRTLTGGG